jgi:hypothetical protein
MIANVDQFFFGPEKIVIFFCPVLAAIAHCEALMSMANGFGQHPSILG